MGRKRKNPIHMTLPPRVYPNKYSYVWKPTSKESVTLTRIDEGIPRLWQKYEEEVNQRHHSVTFEKLWRKFMASAYFTELKPRTQKDYLQHEKKLISVFGHVLADNIRPEHVRTFMDKRGLQSKTQANHEMSSMSRAFRWGYERGMVKRNPCHGISRFKSEARDKYITDKEYEAIYNNADDVVRVAMEIAYLCAARLSDVLGMQWRQVTKEGVFIQQGKNSVKQIKQWTERLHHAFELAKTFSNPGNPASFVIIGTHGSGFSKRGFSHRWEDARHKASVALGYDINCTFHDLKAKGISDYEGSSRDKQLFSGHKTESQVLIYDRKTKISPSLNRPPIKERYSK
ncbi:tyrosine-type recombinase/integrase [Salmonella enterica]|uniref:Tyrosine-type recombinase/integrase n=2 Tax=Salmonella enterica TaxID=28901 RepID=A0A6Y5LGB5_SALDZ|nr:integrase [Salmonella enterica]EBF6639562.1 integrase [Salmonella enterica subsp. enterica serovar Reading]EBW6386734.1 integrase [Salmonella enterica subsp. enterica serovar Stanley]ECG5642387.1 integrase [Salmonella enterica subsp. enterica serovar Poona]ECJ2514979.1 tyrosine-type recombinase/integrase [Salmonella enterica subsp. diarizonae]EDA1490831.1 tyrosine-type recombinase/integrase [Salmonella enterica subsp. enterica serovar Coeln]EDV4520649.1 tyrosine-type recombinase/integrase 